MSPYAKPRCECCGQKVRKKRDIDDTYQRWVASLIFMLDIDISAALQMNLKQVEYYVILLRKKFEKLVGRKLTRVGLARAILSAGWTIDWRQLNAYIERGDGAKVKTNGNT